MGEDSDFVETGSHLTFLSVKKKIEIQHFCQRTVPLLVLDGEQKLIITEGKSRFDLLLQS